MNKPIPKLTEKQLKRFWDKVDKSGDCWLWTASTFKSGYGTFGIRDHSYRAHRISYTIANGDPGELNVNHTCDNPRCVNPAHLWLGTQREGMDDKVAKDRQTRGEANVHVLTEKQAKKILTSDKSYASLGRKYGVDEGTIRAIKHDKSWRHLEGKRHTGLRHNNTSGVEGVSFHKMADKYRARYKGKHLGLFTNIKDAAKAVDKHKGSN